MVYPAILSDDRSRYACMDELIQRCLMDCLEVLCAEREREWRLFLPWTWFCTLVFQAYFNDEEMETRAILCRGKDRLVLAFRGTARVENLVTDLKFHQASVA